MVTHDAFVASFCKRVLFLKDGQIFYEILKGKMKRPEFFKKIIDVIERISISVDKGY
jgi:putative ABC transport system ATP-binding protein